MRNLWSSLVEKHFADDESDDITRLELLESIPLFDELTRSELQQLTTLLYERTYEPGERVFSQGDPSSAVFLIEQGSVKIFLDEDDEQTREVSRLDEGDFIGELALCAKHHRTANAEAVNSTRLQVMFRQEVLEFIEREPKIGVQLLLNLARVVATRLHNLNDEIVEQEERIREYERTIEELKARLEGSDEG